MAARALPSLAPLPGGSEGGVTLVELVHFPVLPVLPQVYTGEGGAAMIGILFASPEPGCVSERVFCQLLA